MIICVFAWKTAYQERLLRNLFGRYQALREGKVLLPNFYSLIKLRCGNEVNNKLQVVVFIFEWPSFRTCGDTLVKLDMKRNEKDLYTLAVCTCTDLVPKLRRFTIASAFCLL